MNFIKQNISYLRGKEKLSQAEFGELMGYTRDNIASYERGTEPKIDFIQKIVNYFHISYFDFIDTDLSLNLSNKKPIDVQELNLEKDQFVPDLYEKILQGKEREISALNKTISSQDATINALQQLIEGKENQKAG